MSESENKKLLELRVVDLRAELEKRGLDKNGVKKDLVERLQKALKNEGIDPEIYTFDIGDKKLSKRLSTSSSIHDDGILNEKIEIENNKSEDDTGTKKNLYIVAVEKQGDIEQEITVGHNSAAVENAPEKSQQDSASAINLTLEEEETINEKNTDQVADNLQKSRQELDDTTTSTERVQVEETIGTTTTTFSTTAIATTISTASLHFSKKNQDGDTGTNSSNGTPEESNQQKKPQSNPRILWITNVPKNTRANELKQLLSSCGKVVCAKVVVNARFPGSCCFGYVTMGSAEDATNVIAKLNNTEFNGQIIKIDKFENIRADTLNPSRKNKNEENKKSQFSENKDDKAKKIPEKEKYEEEKESEEKEKNMESSRGSSERRKSRTSDRSSRGRRRTPSRERFRERERPYHRSTSRGAHRASVLTFDKIKEERERQRLRDRERALREDTRRRQEEAIHLREMHEISRRQRNEAERLEREREKLRIERDKIEREKSELIKLERERQRIERDKLEMEKMELQRSRLRLEEDRRTVKRQASLSYKREETFEQRKRPTSDRHFEEPSRFEPPHSSDQVPSKKFVSSKDFKRLLYDSKHEPFLEKRSREFNSERSHQSSSINRSNAAIKYDKSYDSIRKRELRDASSRVLQTNNVIKCTNSRYVERERSPHFRLIPDSRDRHVSQEKCERDHYPELNVLDRRDHPITPQAKFGSNNQKSWTNKGATWRAELSSLERWNQGSCSSGRLSQQFSTNSNLSPACPPPPGINNYSDRFDYKSNSIRKY